MGYKTIFFVLAVIWCLILLLFQFFLEFKDKAGPRKKLNQLRYDLQKSMESFANYLVLHQNEFYSPETTSKLLKYQKDEENISQRMSEVGLYVHIPNSDVMSGTLLDIFSQMIGMLAEDHRAVVSDKMKTLFSEITPEAKLRKDLKILFQQLCEKVMEYGVYGRTHCLIKRSDATLREFQFLETHLGIGKCEEMVAGLK